MKRVYLKPDAILRQNFILPKMKSLRAIKLSYAQVIGFKSGYQNFEDMFKDYGSLAQLKIGEQYHGYIALYLGKYYQMPLLMHGYFTYDRHQNVVLEDGNQPVLRYVYNFEDCRFAETLKADGSLFENAQALEESLKRKLRFKLLCYDNSDPLPEESYMKPETGPLQLSDEEYEMLYRFDPQNFRESFVF